jgi:peptidoglycan/xylan/chitin deacetylase (PgdA/CDA1 family)
MTPPGGQGKKVLKFAALSAAFLLTIPAIAASAAECPGNPNALGTSRTLAVAPAAHPRVGTMQYSEDLSLADHEIILTFDDGPVPRYSKPVLAALAAECVQATFFLVGEMAHAYPATVREIYDAGHSIGTHSETHPLGFDRLILGRAQTEIDEGIGNVTAALGDPEKLSPFFRFPGLRRSEAVEDYLSSRSVAVFSVDFVADDWKHISASEVVHRALARIEAKGRGILLLHDIHPNTVAALPVLLRQLKSRGYRIVHVVGPAAEFASRPTAVH